METYDITYQGIPGSYSSLAASNYFKTHMGSEFRDRSPETIGCRSFRELFLNVISGKAKYGVVPVENSLAGSIHENYDLLKKHTVYVAGETYMRISHCLLGVKSGDMLPGETRINGLIRVMSHPIALEQCQRFFEKHEKIQKVSFSDTAGAARAVAESGRLDEAAIASRESADLYDLQILQSDLEDDSQNFTRFLVIRNASETVENSDKCSLIFTLPHIPASLSKALEIFATRNLNVTKIESRPIPGSRFEYVFYVDFEFPGVGQEKIAHQALAELGKRTTYLKNLGFYRSADVSAAAESA